MARLRKRGHREAEVSTDSLSDIMFFLMLFFLILSTMVSPNAMKVNLPSSANKRQIDSKDPIHLAVTKDHKYFIDSKEVPYSDLEAALVAKINGRAEPTVVIHVDKDLLYQDFIDVMQLGDRLKCKMIAATQPSNGK
jgi:biopolymer transport protein ExbD